MNGPRRRGPQTVRPDGTCGAPHERNSHVHLTHRSPGGAVVVGVGPRGSDAALSFAAEEACLALAPLHLVHVLQLSPAEGFAGVLQGALEAADACLDAAMSPGP